MTANNTTTNNNNTQREKREFEIIEVTPSSGRKAWAYGYPSCVLPLCLSSTTSLFSSFYFSFDLLNLVDINMICSGICRQEVDVT